MSATRWLVLGMVSATVLATPGTAGGQTTVRVTPFVGATLFMTEPPDEFAIEQRSGGDLVVRDGTYRDGATLGVLAGMHLGPLWEVEGLFSWTPTELTARRGLRGDAIDAHAYMYGAHLNFHFPQDLTVAPYLSVGVGGEARDYGVADAAIHSHLMLYAGGGIDLPLTDELGLRLDVRDCFSRFDSRMAGGDDPLSSHLMFLLGLSYGFPAQ